HFVDRVWAGTPEYSGCGFGHLRRWPKDNLTGARQRLEKAKTAARTKLEKDRIALADESLALFEQFMQMRRDLAEGKFSNLAADVKKYRDRMEELAKKHRPDYSFGHVPWAFGGKGGSVNTTYFASFYEATYLDAARLAKDFTLVTPTLRSWRWQKD